MAGFNWDEQPDAFDWDAAEDAEQGPSALESAYMGAEQGVSFGFADEAAGRIAQGVDFVQGLFGDSPTELAQKALNEGIDVGNIPTNRDELYKQVRDEERKKYAKLEEANPEAFMAGGIGGGLLTNVIPGLGLAKGASTAKVVGSAAAQGAAYGAGASEEESAAGIARDAAVGGALSGGIGGAVKLGGDKVAQAIRGQAPAVQKVAQETADYIRPKTRANAAELQAAAKSIGIELTPGMLDDAGFVERLESTLAKNPSIFGRKIAEKQSQVYQGLQRGAEELTSEATALTPFQTGEKFKAGVTAKVGERLDPIAAVFEDVAESTKNIPIKQRSIDAVRRNIEASELYSLTGGEGKPGKYVDMLGRLKNANQVKTMMTLLNNDISDATGAEKAVLLSIKDKLQGLERSSVMRSAIEQARTKGEGSQIGRELVGDLRDARAGYRSLAQDLGGMAKESRMKYSGPSSFVDELEAIPSERIQDRFFNPENTRQLQDLASKFPEEFELLKQGRLKEIAEASQDFATGETSAAKFLKEARKLNPEAQGLLFNDPQKIKQLESINQVMPRNFNPSGTASSGNWQDIIASNVKDVPNYMAYKFLTGPTVGNVTMRLDDIAKNAPQKLGKFGRVMQDAAQRGSQAVAVTNFILQQNNPEYREQLRKLEEEQE